MSKRLQVQHHPASLDKILELVLSDSLGGNLVKFFVGLVVFQDFCSSKASGPSDPFTPLEALPSYDRWVFVLNFLIPS